MRQTLLFLILLLLLGFSACRNPNIIAKTSQQTVTKIDSIKTIIKNLTNSQDIDIDTIKYDELRYPPDSIYSVKIITPGTFHSDEVWEDVETGKWVGLFKTNKEFYTSETNLKVSRIKDEIVDENDNERTGWSIQTVNKDEAILLIEGLNFLINRKIEYAILQNDQLVPGDTLRFSFLGIDYKLFAIGSKRPDIYNPDELFIWNYRLYLSSKKKGEIITELLVAQPNFDDEMINIIFAGDIDGDGFLDLIIDTSRHYNVSIPTLYLSKPADNEHLLKVVGLHISLGC